MPPACWRRMARSLLLACALVGRSVDAASPDAPRGAAAAPVGATAASRDEARQSSVPALMEQGVRQRKAGDDRGARDSFQRAWQLGRSPEALAQLALAEQALGRWVDARTHLLAALEAETHPWIVAHRPILMAALTETASHLGRLDVVCNVSGAELRLDGLLVGRTPLADQLIVNAGQSVLNVSAPGYFDVARTVQVDVGGLARVDVTLTPNVGTGVAHGEGSAGDVRSAIGYTVRDAVMYGSAGLAALGATSAVAGYVLREVNVKRFNDDDRCALQADQTRSQECPESATAFRRAEVIAIAGAATAGVLGGAAIYLWLSRPQPRTTQTACSLSASGLLCTGVF
jgi:PEGA domain